MIRTDTTPAEENARLRAQIQRISAHLALLSDVNRQLTAASGLDEILDAAPLLPQRLLPADGAALLLLDEGRPLVARTYGAIGAHGDMPLTGKPSVAAQTDGLRLVLPLHDGAVLVGWIELALATTIVPQDDELALLETIGSEIAEAISGARRRAHEALAIHRLEQAISEERARIARDIHDGIAQTLAFRRMRIDLWLDWLTSNPEQLRAELTELKHILRDQIADLRRVIFALRPIQFEELGFSAGLQRYVLEFAEQQGWQIDIDLSGISTFAADLEAVSFRIVQEALTNAAKHANAHAVIVALTQGNNGIEISVCDNGRGFDPVSRPEEKPGHFGLRQMRERLAAVGGTLEIKSQLGHGTEIRAWLPVEQYRDAVS